MGNAARGVCLCHLAPGGKRRRSGAAGKGGADFGNAKRASCVSGPPAHPQALGRVRPFAPGSKIKESALDRAGRLPAIAGAFRRSPLVFDRFGRTAAGGVFFKTPLFDSAPPYRMDGAFAGKPQPAGGLGCHQSQRATFHPERKKKLSSEVIWQRAGSREHRPVHFCFMNEEKKEYQVSRATLALALGALGSRGVGFFREIAVAATFGTGRSFDLYVASSAFPSFLSAIFLYALPDYLVPYFARLKERRLAALRRFLFSTFLGGAGFLGALYFSAPLWIKVVASGLAANEISLGAGAFQILLLFVFSTVLEAVLRSYYQVEGRFGLIAWSPLLTGLVVLGSVFLLSGKLSV